MTQSYPLGAPSERDAAEIAVEYSRARVHSVQRFPLGLAHFVFDVALEDGSRIVVRLAGESSPDAFDGARHWLPKLRDLGVPVPVIQHSGEHRGRSFLVLQRLPGVDLGLVYGELTPRQRQRIALEVARIQGLVGSLPEGKGFGFVAHSSGPFPHERWIGVVLETLQQARQQFDAVRVLDSSLADRVARAVDRHASYLESVRATPFLDDTTTKNVLVERGRLSGIVDVDCVCYGDPLFPIGLTWAALTAQGDPTDYVGHWVECLQLTQDQRSGLRLYCALFSLMILGEIGHRFNREHEVYFDASAVQRLSAALDAAGVADG